MITFDNPPERKISFPGVPKLKIIPKKIKPARIVIIDKPQPYRNKRATRADNSNKKTRFGQGADGNYSRGTMTEYDIIKLGDYIRSITAPDAYIFSWVTMPNLPFDMKLLGEHGAPGLWGVEYATMPFVWVKLNKNSGTDLAGGGSYNFSNVEMVALARYPKTKLWHPNNPEYKPLQPLYDPDVSETVCLPHERYPIDRLSSVWEERHPTIPPCRTYFHDPETCKRCLKAGKVVHSRKPECVQEMIEKWLGPYLDGYSAVELFATRKREKWHCLGYDVTEQDIFLDIIDLAERMA